MIHFLLSWIMYFFITILMCNFLYFLMKFHLLDQKKNPSCFITYLCNISTTYFSIHWYLDRLLVGKKWVFFSWSLWYLWYVGGSMGQENIFFILFGTQYTLWKKLTHVLNTSFYILIYLRFVWRVLQEEIHLYKLTFQFKICIF